MHGEERRFYSKRKEEAAPQRRLLTKGERGVEQGDVIGRSGNLIQIENAEEHEERAKERVQEEVVGRFDFSLACTSNTDEKEHWNKKALEENEEKKEVEYDERQDEKKLHRVQVKDELFKGGTHGLRG